MKKPELIQAIAASIAETEQNKGYLQLVKTQTTEDSEIEESLVEKKKNVIQIDYKELFLLFVLNVSVWSVLIMNSISLQNIGISNIVINSLVMTCADFISNLLIFLFFHKIKRKKNLIYLNCVVFLLSTLLLCFSFIPDSGVKHGINLFISFVLKLVVMLVFVLQILFNGNLFFYDSTIIKFKLRLSRQNIGVNQVGSLTLPIQFSSLLFLTWLNGNSILVYILYLFVL